MSDIVVIGGGALGTSIARDAALRGLSVALFEQEDFGSGATARGPRVLSAGLHALETLDFTRVREHLHERETLLQIAPHLVFPLPCLIPFYDSSLLVQARLRASLALTDALEFDKSLPLHQILSAAEAREREPSLCAAGLAGAALVWEARVPDPERLALDTALGARASGASLHSHTRIDSLRHRGVLRGRGRVDGVRWTDTLSGDGGETTASLVINATGAFLSEIGSPLAELTGVRHMRRKCVSVAVPKLRGGREALLFPRDGDGGLVSVVPWQNLSLIGTLETAADTQVPEMPYAAGHEVADLLRPLREFLSGVDWEQPVLALAGVRLSPPFPGPPALPDTHLPLLVDHASSGGLDGLVSVAGGTLLSCRSLAEEVVDLACRKLGRALSTPSCRTASVPLPGAAAPFAAPDIIPGADAALRAAVTLSVAQKECRTLCDFIERRSPLFWAPDQGRSAVPVVVETMAALLGWDAARQEREERAWEADAALTQAFRVL